MLNLGTWGVPIGIGSSGSVGANGALTLTTAFANTNPTIWLYFPAGACYANSPAGIYYVVMSSASAGIIYNIRLGTDQPYIPAAEVLTQRGIVSASVGAYTQTTAAIDLVSVVVPGQSMGANGILFWIGEFSVPNNANNKTISWTFGGQSANSITASSTAAARYYRMIANRGSTSSQYTSQIALQTTGGAPNLFSVNTDQNQTLLTRGQLAVATDYVLLETQTIQVFYGL